ncbi:MAG: tRNA (adenosine(37)-N6)-dimethylallyltransferase MiaA [Muribaculaceae bacterium]|nr:tRNA (adenosine(37)-N6)-dimethylallyltransferase MiaA [Muribaculaceae bacterium]MDE7031739.1 tRNA (adenosine(37)-N6)-dimethylallyltransferase MiaA [Muribaculaceae bacterium]
MKTLIVITGATASGKTSVALDVAEALGCDIISADSRQIYSGLPIGTAAPTAGEQARVRHHLVGTLPLDAYYSASQFEHDALRLMEQQWQRGDYALVCGGSMMYVDALLYGLDPLPAVSETTRAHVAAIFSHSGIEGLRAALQIVDPKYMETADPANHKRLIHALEVSYQAGAPYSSLCSGQRRQLPCRVVKAMIDMERETLFSRINRRVGMMMDQGLLDEARRVYPQRHLNSLNTVGYKELFAYFDGVWDLDTALARMAKNTRVYAKKQLTWLKRPGRNEDLLRLTPENAVKELIDFTLRPDSSAGR